MLISKKLPRFQKKRGIRFHFFISYILVLIIPIIIGSLAYYRAYNIVEKKELETRNLLLNESMLSMDNTIKKIDAMLIDLAINSDLSKVLYMSSQPTYGSPDAALLYEANQILSSYAMSSGLGSDFMLFMNQPDLVFSGRSIVYGSERFYDIAVSYEGMSYEEFKKEVLDSYHFHYAIGNVESVEKRGFNSPDLYVKEKGILYISSLPLGGNRNNIIAATVVRISNNISGILTSVPISDYGCTYIADSEQNILTGVFGDKYSPQSTALSFDGRRGSFYEKIGNQKMLISYVQSDYNDWYYVSMSPMNKIMGDLNELRIMIFVITGVVVAIGMLISFLLSQRDSKPFEMALMELQKNSANSSPNFTFSGLIEGIGRIISTNENLSETLGKQNSMMKISFFDRLFHGDFTDDDSMIATQHYLGLDIKGEMYCVLVLSYNHHEKTISSQTLFESDILQIFTEEISLRNMSFKAYPHKLSSGRLSVLICFESNDKQISKQLLKKELDSLISNTTQRFVSRLNCSIGNFYEKLSDVYLSFGEACSITDFDEEASGSIVFYQDVSRDNSGYFYPNEIETKLKNIVISANKEGLLETLNYIYNENFNQRHIPGNMAVYLFMDLQTTLIKISRELKLDWETPSPFRVKPESLNHEVEFENITKEYNKLCSLSENRPKSSGVIGQIFDYVNSNYQNQNISVSFMAQKFRFSDSYFSQYFKANTGQIFSKYLEMLRINKACELIKNSTLNIDEIASVVGYNNTLSFRRAFKRVIGIPPSSYHPISG